MDFSSWIKFCWNSCRFLLFVVEIELNSNLLFSLLTLLLSQFEDEDVANKTSSFRRGGDNGLLVPGTKTSSFRRELDELLEASFLALILSDSNFFDSIDFMTVCSDLTLSLVISSLSLFCGKKI